jgi:hypothetical protein
MWALSRSFGEAIVFGSADHAVIPVASAIHHLYLDRTNLPALGSLTRFEFSTIGR